MKPALATGQPDSQFTHAVSELDRSSRRALLLADDFGKRREPDICIAGAVYCLVTVLQLTRFMSPDCQKFLKIRTTPRCCSS